MSTLAQRKMTVDEFLAWAEGREGRWELYNGVPYAMPAERTAHIAVKHAVFIALFRTVLKAGVPCQVVGDGAGVRISRHVMYGPDTLVYNGPELPGDALEVPNPVIVVEVLSPSTHKFDETVKKDGYFSLPSVQHYLIVDPEGPPRRQPDGTILRLEVHEGSRTARRRPRRRPRSHPTPWIGRRPPAGKGRSSSRDLLELNGPCRRGAFTLDGG